jgi:hypothetical protein
MIKRSPTTLRLTGRILAVAVLLSAVTAAFAATPASQAQLRYKQDRAKCMRGETNQDRATCLKEAAAALQESRNLGAAGDGELARNRLKRCETLPFSQREDCVARMNEGTTSGSAQQGGMLREVSRPAK